ncbi:hypothetical protein N0V90_012544 [Kalmusia sp. IMI 367209]|nr:hypothetical protein N0V90_012544 [Kalmusia sp. IMI 367209]
MLKYYAFVVNLLPFVSFNHALSVAGITSPVSESSALSIRDTSYLTPGCQNTNTSRKCWGEFDINTNWYDTIFHTGRTVEYWLTVEEIDCAPDGYRTKCIVANGTMPGPAIIADWGDDVVVHVTNNIANNGTAIHWHGIRQLHNTQYDGAPGASQCPIAPGKTMTYKFHASQYGTSMYHSHLSVQYSEGLFGPLIINGPATAEYDEELEPIILTDWNHHTAFAHWSTISNFNVSFNGAFTGLINGINTGNCTAANATALDPNCINEGEKYQLVFEAGKKYRLRLINLASESWFQFSIDGHTMTVISADLVPIVPYETDSVLVNMGERYDVIVEANAPPGDYWLRGGLIDFCIPNDSTENITAIVRYNNSSIEIPTTVSTVVKIETCLDEPATNVVPWVPIDLPNMDGGIYAENVTGEYYLNKYLRWSFNQPSGGFLWTNWSQPALRDVISGDFGAIPKSDNVFQIGGTFVTDVDYQALNSSTAASRGNASNETEWAILVIDELTPIPGLNSPSPPFSVSHPIHLHGHDFLVLEAGANARWDGTTNGWQSKNPPRRDTVILPPNGYIVIAFALDNPGVWLLHCHIAWHSSQGFGATILESPALIPGSGATSDWDKEFEPMCNDWDDWYPSSPFKQEDSGV